LYICVANQKPVNGIDYNYFGIMRNRITILLALFFTFASLRSTAQSTCNCWQPRDPSYSLVPFAHDYTTLATPVAADYYRNDDAATNLITLPFSFCFFGTSVTQIYIDNNGYVAFGPKALPMFTSISSWDPSTFPSSVAEIIAPFYSDVDTRIANSSSDVGNTVWYKITPTHIIIQWDSVGYWDKHFNLGNTFQLIITNGTDPIVPNGNNIEFCYQNMQWAVGDAQQGNSGFDSPLNPAVVGINEGNGTGNIQYGLFNTATATYNGAYPTSPFDGVYWLINQQFIMDGCTGNSPPILVGLSGCGTDTLVVCEGDTLKVPLKFYSVISGVTVNSGLSNPVVPGSSISYNNPTTQADSLVIQVIGNSSNLGYNTVDFYGYDNFSPPDTTFASFVVHVIPAPVVTISASPDTVCLGNNSILTAGGGGTYLWSNGATTSSIVITPAATTTYSVVISNGNCTKDTNITVVIAPPLVLAVTPANTGACSGDSVKLTASGASTYVWSPTTGLSCSTCSSVSAAPAVATVYTITGSANGCSATITDTVSIYPIPTIAITATSDSICSGNPDQLLASGAATYLWAPSTGLSCNTCPNPIATPTVTTTYTVIGTTAEGCSNAASITIYVFPTPLLSVSPNVSICPGRTVTLIASGSGSSYNWTPGNITGPVITVTPTSTQTYTVTMPTGCGTSTANVTVFVNPQPVPDFSADVTQGCSPLCVQFRNRSTISSGSISAWDWTFGNGDTAISQDPIYCYQYPGIYSITITTISDSGCSATLTINDYIDVYSHPNAAFTMSPQPTTILQPTIQFTDQSTDAYGVADWNWSFGDASDSVSYLENPSHTYQDTGTYCARLIVMNIHGCVDSVTNCLVIDPMYCLYIPSAFSPNGDNRNEKFMAKGNDVKSFEMYIFDRWGMQLFHSTDINDGWNGTIKGNGSICQEDTYVYMITVYDNKNTKHSYTGSVNLVK
jgi:gliding motility-associated-like protein